MIENNYHYDKGIYELEQENQKLKATLNEAFEIIKAIRVSDRVDTRQALYDEAQEFLRGSK